MNADLKKRSMKYTNGGAAPLSFGGCRKGRALPHIGRRSRFVPSLSNRKQALRSSCTQWGEGVLEDVVRYATPLRDALRLIKGPVDAEVDSALAIFFLGLRQ